MPDTPTWIVTTSGERPVAEIAAALAKAGLEGVSVLAEIGVISGRCAKSKLSALRKVAGVSEIAPDAPVNIGPPGSPHTW
jgi:hypothetical protein